MDNTTDNKPRDYMFIYRYDYKVCIIDNADSFKDAIYKLCEYNGVTSLASGDVVKKAFIGFDDDDIYGIVSLYNLLSEIKIYSAFLIDKKLYDSTEG